MRQKYFLKLDGVRGESQSARHLDEIEISSFMWGSKHPPVTNVGRGKAVINDLIINKRRDKTSAILWVAVIPDNLSHKDYLQRKKCPNKEICFVR